MNTYICLENIRSLYNIGAIFRTCSFYGIYNVVLLGYAGKTHDSSGHTVLHSEILKTSLGAEKDLTILMLKEPTELIDFAKENDFEIISIEQTDNSVDIHQYAKDTENAFENKIIVFGNEAVGVTPELQAASTHILELPRKGEHNSLNVTTTCGIVLDIISQNSTNNI